MGNLVSMGWVLGILTDKVPGILGPALRTLGRYVLGDLVFVLTSVAGGDCAAHDSPSPARRLRAAGETDCSS